MNYNVFHGLEKHGDLLVSGSIPSPSSTGDDTYYLTRHIPEVNKKYII